MIRLATTNTAPTVRRRHFARVETAWAMPRKYVSQSGTVNSLMAPILAVGASWRRLGVETGSRSYGVVHDEACPDPARRRPARTGVAGVARRRRRRRQLAGEPARAAGRYVRRHRARGGASGPGGVAPPGVRRLERR